ncbi:predicted protein [Sparassis crispa]|uniref:Uncharacterized protein n=1 Tax=Sparassis crispa TaxID=139825 RepID=A0A401GY56_9APHY|nr:predicted protein [Sparassis crispa]GBE87137.1 predicted protein [Sparassis crispa]
MKGKRDGEELKPHSTKRARMTLPPGFVQKKQPINVSAPKFVSAFGDASSPSTPGPSKARVGSTDLEKLRAGHLSAFGEVSPVKKVPERPPKAPPVVLPSPPKSAEDGMQAVVSALRQPVGVSESASGRLRSISGLQLRPSISSTMKPMSLGPRPPPANPLRSSKPLSSVTPISRPPPFPGTSSSMKPISRTIPIPPPPKHGASPSKNPASLKSIAAPPSFAPKTPSRSVQREMKTIFTTNVALATDPHTESGSAELLSIFVQQHGHGYVDPVERELLRGLGQSPEKASKNKNKDAKYLRGGLADNAKCLFGHNDTALLLWQTDIHNCIRNSRRVVPELRLRIVSVFHVSKGTGNHRSHQPPCLAILRCRNSGNQSAEVLNILLNIGSPCANLRMNKVEDVQEGREVYVWRPWHNVDLSSTSLLADGVDPSGSGSVIFCSRFWIPPL